ncbi:TRL-like family protein [Campylobacter troglodytis]|uniref:TRL-like family protein n=1 Tax=Campylobacter troglodytis TaxID=654363 RepID=UPI0011583F47|nr:TRL-like family protein [Campylobacter troglodytis]TQR61308.1 hypothetical protein DMC01_01650 [Campylobacter troglodytis]
MKKVLGVTALVAVLFTACATPLPTGQLYTGINLPISGNANSGGKTGEASCTSILGLVAMGDCSVSKAAENGSISNIQTVDFKVNNFFGLFGTYTTTVKGN